MQIINQTIIWGCPEQNLKSTHRHPCGGEAVTGGPATQRPCPDSDKRDCFEDKTPAFPQSPPAGKVSLRSALKQTIFHIP